MILAAFAVLAACVPVGPERSEGVSIPGTEETAHTSKKVVAAFTVAGLEARKPRPMTREDFGAAPMLTKDALSSTGRCNTGHGSVSIGRWGVGANGKAGVNGRAETGVVVAVEAGRWASADLTFRSRDTLTAGDEAGGQDVVRIKGVVGVEPPRKCMGQCPSARSISVHV